MYPDLSIIVMTSNDEIRLKRCLRSVIALDAPILVLDTGSVDNSVNVAKSLGAKVYEMAWADRFDLPLNYLLDQVETEWVLRLDSDEWCDDDQLRLLPNLLADPKILGYRLVRRDIVLSGLYAKVDAFRLGRNFRGMRYFGLVHEHFPSSRVIAKSAGLTVAESDWWFWHDGLAVEGADRLQRNSHLVERQLLLTPNDPIYLVYRGIHLLAKDTPAGFDSLQAVVQDCVRGAAPMPFNLPSGCAAVLFNCPMEEIYSASISLILKFALDSYPETPYVLWASYTLFYKRRNYDSAVQMLLEPKKCAVNRIKKGLMPLTFYAQFYWPFSQFISV